VLIDKCYQRQQSYYANIHSYFTNSTNSIAYNKYRHIVCYATHCRTSFEEEQGENISPLYVEFPVSFSLNLWIYY
jgi:hypothetical protein